YNTYRTLVVVILYNKKIVDSLTIDSINDSSLENATLFVVNNGPSIVTLNDECAPFLSRPNNNVKLFNYTENRPLSVIYNE
ncbi:glycosyl transferase, partial [Acinetobacter baumannii]